jgi:parvulin-like peptidyl-prolyl isomerase
MANLADLSLDAQEVVEFLRQNLRLPEIYQAIVEQKIIHQVALEYGITVTLPEIETEIENIRYEKTFDNPTGFVDWLSDCGATLSDLKQMLRSNLLTKKVMRSLFVDRVESVFSQDRHSFDQLVLYKIVVPYEHLAREIFYQIEEEEISFFEAAHVYDIDESRRLSCGYEGTILRHDLPSDLAEVLSTARVGELVGPFKAANQFYELFWIDDLIYPDLTPALQSRILQQLYQNWMERHIHDYLDSFTSQAE